MEYGLQIEPAFGFSYDEAVTVARAAQDLGYSAVWASDHFLLDPSRPDLNCMDCWTLLAGLARDTTSIRIGSLVTCVTYRNPAVLAKVAATVDTMSGGRLIFGLGAGWNAAEHRAYGIAFPDPGERVGRLREALEITERLWTQATTTYDGRYYRLVDAPSAPKPLQKPRPPILVGGSKPRLLKLMARHADLINMGSGQTPETYGKNLRSLEELCRAEKRDLATIKKTHLMTFVVGKDRQEASEVISRVAQQAGKTADEYVSNRGTTFIGTAPEAVATIQEFADAGVQHIMTRFPFGEELRSMRLFADAIMPETRGSN